jgi:hypothetical protein
MSSKPELNIDYCSREAAKYAVEKWHYSRQMPTFKLVTFGIWENKKFVGTVIFGGGATPNLLKPYGLGQFEGCELVRVAMTNHKTPVSRVVAIALRMLKKTSPGLRLVVSFADPSEGHSGGIYKAGGWIYTGTMSEARYFKVHGKVRHPRSIGQKGVKQSLDAVRKNLDPFASIVVKPGKHRYLMPLDDAMIKQCKQLAQPYPVTVQSSTQAREA